MFRCWGLGVVAASAVLAQPPPAARVIDILTGQGIPGVNVRLLSPAGVETVSGPNGEFTPAPRGDAAAILMKAGYRQLTTGYNNARDACCQWYWDLQGRVIGSQRYYSMMPQ